MPNYKSLRNAVRAAIQACRDGASDRYLGRVDIAAVIPVRGGYDLRYNHTRYDHDPDPIYRTRAIDWADVKPDDLDTEIGAAIADAETALLESRRSMNPVTDLKELSDEELIDRAIRAYLRSHRREAGLMPQPDPARCTVQGSVVKVENVNGLLVMYGICKKRLRRIF